MHSAIGAIIELSKEYAIESEDVEKGYSKNILSYNVNLMCGLPPETPVHARLHMPYSLACALAQKSGLL